MYKCGSSYADQHVSHMEMIPVYKKKTTVVIERTVEKNHINNRKIINKTPQHD